MSDRDISGQERQNLDILACHQHIDSELDPLMRLIAKNRPSTVRDAVRLCPSVKVGCAVVFTLLAHGVCETALDKPINTASSLQWSSPLATKRALHHALSPDRPRYSRREDQRTKRHDYGRYPAIRSYPMRGITTTPPRRQPDQPLPTESAHLTILVDLATRCVVYVWLVAGPNPSIAKALLRRAVPQGTRVDLGTQQPDARPGHEHRRVEDVKRFLALVEQLRIDPVVSRYLLPTDKALVERAFAVQEQIAATDQSITVTVTKTSHRVTSHTTAVGRPPTTSPTTTAKPHELRGPTGIPAPQGDPK